MGNAIPRSFDMAKPEESLVAKFEAVSREMKGQDFNTSSATPSRRITDPQEMEAFHDWMMAFPSFRAPFNFRLTGEEFVGQVESMNFLNKKACEKLIQSKCEIWYRHTYRIRRPLPLPSCHKAFPTRTTFAEEESQTVQ
jgi:hypothetical protein